MTKQEWNDKIEREFTKVYILIAFLLANPPEKLNKREALRQETRVLFYRWINLRPYSKSRDLLIEDCRKLIDQCKQKGN